ncbi:hypothetical protein QAD02_019103 [Eretmocerus hayati]|uniref:Uncharacterized protein n=1 Tax=Eretmocerus hayati TaxID=131215 RepID=A0ACC2PJU4_9HYME|nr:hypothetical protein QAD02_019103 [Eretmocerus hayati]
MTFIKKKKSNECSQQGNLNEKKNESSELVLNVSNDIPLREYNRNTDSNSVDTPTRTQLNSKNRDPYFKLCEDVLQEYVFYIIMLKRNKFFEKVTKVVVDDRVYKSLARVANFGKLKGDDYYDIYAEIKQVFPTDTNVKAYYEPPIPDNKASGSEKKRATGCLFHAYDDFTDTAADIGLIDFDIDLFLKLNEAKNTEDQHNRFKGTETSGNLIKYWPQWALSIVNATVKFDDEATQHGRIKDLIPVTIIASKTLAKKVSFS